MIYNEKENDYENILNHQEACWLSSGSALKIVIRVKEDVFLYKKTSKCSKFGELFLRTSGCWQFATSEISTKI